MVSELIYIYEDDLNLESALDLKKIELLMEKDRREKVRKYKFLKDKKLCVIAFLLLKLGLYREYKLHDIPEIIMKNKNKPYFKDKNIYFNLSHCDTSVACIIDCAEVGIDVQDYLKEIISLENKVLTYDEINKSNKSIEEITRFWTIKEAYGKYYGVGLNYSFKEKNFYFIEDSFEWQMYEELMIFSKRFKTFSISAVTKHCVPIHRISKEELIEFANKALNERKIIL